MTKLDIVRMYRREFAAAHIIEGHPKCGRMHGHNYQLLVRVYGKSSEWFDFEKIKRGVDEYIDKKYDHRNIGNITCEQLARQIQTHLTGHFKSRVEVELWETSKFGVQTV